VAYLFRSSHERRVALLALLVASACGAFLCYYRGAFQRPVAACRLEFQDITLDLDDPRQVEALVLRPMRLARPDLSNDDYKGACRLVLEYADGGVRRYSLFTPFGYYQDQAANSYHVADFRMLQREIRRRLQEKRVKHAIRSVGYEP
jgi:hypothetical protein